jgi:hypothetical protein
MSLFVVTSKTKYLRQSKISTKVNKLSSKQRQELIY